MKQPLVPVALAFLFGIVVTEFFPGPPTVLLVTALGAWAFAVGSKQRRPAFLLLATTLAGAARHAEWSEPIGATDLRNRVHDLPVLATVRGELTETPVVRQLDRRGTTHERTVVALRVTALGIDSDWRPASGLVSVTTRGTLPADYFRGQQVEVQGVLQLPRPAEAPGLFDHRAYLRHQGIYFQLAADSAADWQLASGARIAPPWSEQFLPWARSVLARGLPADESLRLIWAMTLGWKTALTEELEEPFMRSGTMHVFAISGLHIALIAAVIVAALRLVRLSRAYCGAVAIPITWAYIVATGWQPSAVRSGVMASIVVGGWALERPGQLLNSLAAAALVLLALEPGQLFLPGFQLSFGVVASLAVLTGPFQSAWQRWFQFDPWLPAELRPRWQRWLASPLHWTGLNLGTAVAAWLGALPLTVHYFHLVNPVSLFANLVIVPLSSGVLIAALVSLLCGDWLPGLGEVFNASAWVGMHTMVALSRWFARLPGSSWNVVAPPLAWWIPYYAALLGTGTGWIWKNDRARWAAVLAAGVAVAAGFTYQRHEARPRLTVLANGGGLWLDLPGTPHDLLLDPGNESATRFVTEPFLRAQGVDALPTLALSHVDVRHAGGLGEFLTNGWVRSLSLPATRTRSPVGRQLDQACSQLQIKAQRLQRGDRLNGWRVLHPAADDNFSAAEDQALVLAGEIGPWRLVLLSDLGRLGQRRLLEREPDLQADVVITGVPLTGEPLSPPLLDALQPQLVIVTDADFPVAHRLKPATRTRLESTGGILLLLRESGTVELEVHASAPHVLSWGSKSSFVLDRPTSIPEDITLP